MAWDQFLLLLMLEIRPKLPKMSIQTLQSPLLSVPQLQGIVRGRREGEREFSSMEMLLLNVIAGVCDWLALWLEEERGNTWVKHSWGLCLYTFPLTLFTRQYLLSTIPVFIFFKPYFFPQVRSDKLKLFFPMCGRYKSTRHLCCGLWSKHCCWDLCDQSKERKTSQQNLALVGFCQGFCHSHWTGWGSLWLLWLQWIAVWWNP